MPIRTRLKVPRTEEIFERPRRTACWVRLEPMSRRLLTSAIVCRKFGEARIFWKQLMQVRGPTGPETASLLTGKCVS